MIIWSKEIVYADDEIKWSFKQVGHFVTFSIFVILLRHPFYPFAWITINCNNRLRPLSISQFQCDLSRSTQRDAVSDRYEDMLALILIYQHSLAPFLAWFPLEDDGLALNSKFILKPLLHLLLVQSVNIKESLRASNRRNVQDNAQMTGISALIFVKNAISINQDHLRP